MDPSQEKIMPDVAENQRSSFLTPLNWVGMEKVALPLKLKGGQQVQAEADIFVNVAKKEAKGIHMSRLYLSINESFANEVLSVSLVQEVLDHFVDSQRGLSNSAKIVLRWSEMHRRKALLSEFSGWKTYPAELHAEKSKGEFKIDLKFSFFYSSACPCSAALSRQLYQQAFSKEFCDDNLNFEKVFNWLGENQIATPHSQRSRADVIVRLAENTDSISIIKCIDLLETSLKTPVQTAVKREDEQEFARLNGENTMFVEDSLRIMKNALSNFKEVESFEVKTHHFESLHAHDAVGSVTSDH